MENRFEHSPEEQSAYSSLCSRVRESLPELLENDGSVRPEQAIALYGHLAVCRSCAREYSQMQQVVARLESLPMAELPMDYSGPIMRRIQAQAETTGGVKPPTVIDNAAARRRTAEPRTTPHQHAARTEAASLRSSAQTYAAAVTQQAALRRLVGGGILSGVLAFFLSSMWGRQMLGVNVTTAGTWLEQIADLARTIPLVGWVIGLIASALTEASRQLYQTYRELGPQVASGLALDIAMAALALLYVRRQRAHETGA